MLDSVLIANRGEIACRIIRTCRRLGVRTVAVFADADRDALHVRQADEAVHIGPSEPAQSYLRVERILDAAKRTRAAAIHPGYGFLAERPAFAQAVRDAGLVFVGPSAAAMARLGDKNSAKAVMEAAGVPVVPGYHEADQGDERLKAAAAEVGFPLLIKAVAGGGGKGMRRVDRLADFEEALAACRREAKAAFGDERVLLERLILRPRHVEVQVFADRHGSAVHLFERDCTLQRRHQKIIEEAPAFGLAPDLRARLGAAAVQAALATQYENAGTVEFLVEPDGRFHFIEMNTRLQVEHPVTEAITGLDLVEWQLRIAAGEPLPLRQEAITGTGHALEARLYAEDPTRGFLPATGRLTRLRLPAGARVDTGVEEGDLVTPFYDPMIAKLIVHGPDRPSALALLATALDATEVQGPITNLAFLRRILDTDEFQGMTIDTGWLDGGGVAQLVAPEEPSTQDLTLAALAVVLQREQEAAAAARHHPDPGSPFNLATGWRLNAPWRQMVRFADRPALAVDRVQDGFVVGERTLRAGRDEDGWWAEIDGARTRFRVELTPDQLVLVHRGRRVALGLEPDLVAAAEEIAGSGLIAAPMPGKVGRLLVAVGDRVERGQALAILEAMKMEHSLKAPDAGMVTAVHVAQGEQIDEGTVLLDLEADA